MLSDFLLPFTGTPLLFIKEQVLQIRLRIIFFPHIAPPKIFSCQYMPEAAKKPPVFVDRKTFFRYNAV
jgi:hypothetical protein